jgi:prepilin-type N-terminal cleavage/methylation domain-containing protein
MKVFAQKMKDMLETRKQQLAAKKRNNDGFTLLELLVVVAILAAIAGTATIALKDTDARASAAAHVTMMDELNKGISTYRVLQRNTYPNRFDSLMQTTTTGVYTGATALSILGFDAADGYAIAAIPANVQTLMYEAGVKELRYVEAIATVDPAGEGNCADVKALVTNRGNDVVAGNIFMSDDANGCGVSVNLWDGDGTAPTALPMGMYWTGGTERLTGQNEHAGTTADPHNAYLLTGIGPSSTLFDANTLGGMTTVPVYRHVKPDEYNRFIAVWKVGTYEGDLEDVATAAITPTDQLDLIAIVDGALDTKEEELGEWDGTRNTI